MIIWILLSVQTFTACVPSLIFFHFLPEFQTLPARSRAQRATHARLSSWPSRTPKYARSSKARILQQKASGLRQRARTSLRGTPRLRYVEEETKGHTLAPRTRAQMSFVDFVNFWQSFDTSNSLKVSLKPRVSVLIDFQTIPTERGPPGMPGYPPPGRQNSAPPGPGMPGWGPRSQFSDQRWPGPAPEWLNATSPNKMGPPYMGAQIGRVGPPQPYGGMQQKMPQPPMGSPGPLSSLSNLAARKDLLFPPDCVEAVTPLTTKRRRLFSKDVAPVDAWRLMMSLKSGLLAHGLNLAYEFSHKAFLNQFRSQVGIQNNGHIVVFLCHIAVLLGNIDQQVVLCQHHFLAVIVKGKLSLLIQGIHGSAAVDIGQSLANPV